MINLRYYLHRAWRNHRRPRCTAKPKRGKAKLVLEPLEDRTLLSIQLDGIPSWIAQGPGPEINGQTEGLTDQMNPEAGAINQVAVDPSNPDRMFVATVNGGIWRTCDATDTVFGPHWTHLTDRLPSLSIGSIAFGAFDSNYKTLFAGTGLFTSGSSGGGPTVGVYRTTDRGETWSIFGSDQFKNQNIIKIIPTSIGTSLTDEWVLAATTNGNGSGGIFLSKDGGEQWQPISGLPGSGLPTDDVTDLIADPGNPLSFYAVIPGVYNGSPYFLIRPGLGVFHSIDGGQHWQPMTTGIFPQDMANSNMMQLAASYSVDSATGNLVDAIYMNQFGPGNSFSDVYRSTDGGNTWVPMDSPGETESINGIPTFEFLAGGRGFVADPQNPNLVFMGDTTQIFGSNPNALGAQAFSGRIFRGDFSHLSGSQWQAVTNNGAQGTSPHADSRYLIFDDSHNLLNVNDGGIYRLIDPTGASPRWESANGDIQPTEFYGVAFDPISNVIIGGAQDVGMLQQQDSGAAQGGQPPNFIWDSVVVGDGGIPAVDSKTIPGHSIRYAYSNSFTGLQRQVFDSHNSPNGLAVGVQQIVQNTNGLTLGQIDANVPFLAPYALNAVTPQRMLIGTNYLYESGDKGDVLFSLGGLTQDSNGNTVPMTPLDPASSVTAMAYGGYVNGQPDGDFTLVGTGQHLYVRTARVNKDLTDFSVYTNYQGTGGHEIVLDPDNDRIAFVLDGNGDVWWTNDAGNVNALWTKITGNLTALAGTDIRTIQYANLGAAQVVFVGGKAGVFATDLSAPGATTWVPLGQGLPRVIVNDLHYVPSQVSGQDFLLVGTYGRGAWTLPNPTAQLTQAILLTVQGDDFGPSDDQIVVSRLQENSSFLQVLVNNQPQFIGRLDQVQNITVNGGEGSNTLVVDSTHGLISIPNNINYNGGAGFNSLILQQYGGPSHALDIFDAVQTTSLILNTDGANQAIAFFDVSSFQDLVPADSLQVNDPVVSGDFIRYVGVAGSDHTLIAGNNSFPIEFSQKFSVSILTIAGDDTLQINFSNGNPIPVGSLSFDGVGGNNTLIGPNQANDWSITGVNSGTLDGNISFSSVQNLTGGLAADSFSIHFGGEITGMVDGGGGLDSLSWEDQPNSAFSTWSIGGASVARTYFTVFNFIRIPITAAVHFQGISMLVLDGGSGGSEFDVSPNTQDLDELTASVTIHGGGTSDSAVFDDQNNSFFSYWSVDGSSVTRTYFTLVLIDGQLFRIPVTKTIQYSGLSSLELNGSNGGNEFDLSPKTQVLDELPATVRVNGAGVSDTAVLNDQNNLTLVFPAIWRVDGTSVVRSYRTFSGTITRTIDYSGLSNLVLNGGSGASEFDLSPTLNNLDELPATITIHGGGTSNSVNVMDQGNAHTSTWEINNIGLTRTWLALVRVGEIFRLVPITRTVNYSALTSLSVNGGGGDNTFNVRSTADGASVQVNAGSGDDTINIGNVANSLDDIQGAITINGQGGNDGVNVNDQGTAGGNSVNFVAPIIHRSGAASVAYDAAVESVVYNASNGLHQVGFVSTVPGTTVSYIGSALLGDALVYADTGDSQWTLTGPGAGTLLGPHCRLNFTNIAFLIGGFGRDLFIFTGNGSVTGGITSRGVGTLDYSAYQGDVSVNLGLGTATGTGLGISNIRNVTGSIGNDLIVGDSNANVLIGGRGLNIIIGGAGADQISGGGGDNILIGSTTLWDADAVALQALMQVWTNPVSGFDQRVNALRKGIVVGGRTVALNSRTVMKDTSPDSLMGGGGQNWFFFDFDDNINNGAGPGPNDRVTRV